MNKDPLNTIILFSLENQEIGIMKSIQVENANGRYYALRDGRIISVCNQQPAELIPLDNGNGYKYVKIGKHNYYIHKLIADSFLLYDKNEKTQIHHIDLNKANNNINNLLPVSIEQHRFIHNFLKNKQGIVKWEQQQIQ